VLYTLLSVFEPSSHALQALADRSKAAAPKPAKPSLKKEDAVAPVEPEPQAPKVSMGHCNACMCMFVAEGMHNPGQHADAQVLSSSPDQ